MTTSPSSYPQQALHQLFYFDTHVPCSYPLRAGEELASAPSQEGKVYSDQRCQAPGEDCPYRRLRGLQPSALPPSGGGFRFKSRTKVLFFSTTPFLSSGPCKHFDIPSSARLISAHLYSLSSSINQYKSSTRHSSINQYKSILLVCLRHDMSRPTNFKKHVPS